MAGDVALFIDTNQYLKLYGVVAGKQLLDWLEEQQAHIFVSSQTVDEVLRRKLDSAQTFFVDKLKEIDQIKGSPIPDILLGIGDEKVAEFRKILEQAAGLKTELTKLANDTLSKISRSEDEVSQRLERLFAKAKQPSPDEMQRARDRKERGNPPGKQKNALGDQITWEQLLTFCNETKRLWIITDDSDYCIKHGKLVLLNSLLHRELMLTCDAGPELHCFANLEEGITDFRKNVGVTADKLPTEQVSTEIKKQLDELPPFFDSLSNTPMNIIRPNHHQGAVFTYAAGDDGWLEYAAAQEAVRIRQAANAAIAASEPDHNN